MHASCYSQTRGRSLDQLLLVPLLEHLRLGAGGVAHNGHIDVATQVDALQQTRTGGQQGECALRRPAIAG